MLRSTLADITTSDAEQEGDSNSTQTDRAPLNRDPIGRGRCAGDPREPWRKPSSLQEQASGAEAEEPRRDVHGAPEGRDTRMSASDIDALRAQISRCWAPPVGGLGSDAIIVKLRIVLNEDGTLSRAPEVANHHASPFFPPAATVFPRSIPCQPTGMPPEPTAMADMLRFRPHPHVGC